MCLEEAWENERKLELALRGFGVGEESMASGGGIRDERAAPGQPGEGCGCLRRPD